MYTIWVLTLSLAAVSADVGLGYHYKVPETSYGVPSYQLGNSGYNNGFSGSTASSTGTTATGFTSQPVKYSVGSSNTGYSGSSNSGYATSGLGSGYNYNSQGTTGGSGYNYNTQGSGLGAVSTTQGSGSVYNVNGAGSTSQGAYQGSVGQNAQSILDGYYQTGSSGFVGNQPSQSAGSDYYNQYQTSNAYQSSAVNKYQEYYNQVVQQPPQIFKHFYVHAAPEEPEIPKPRQPLVLPPPQKHYKIIFIKTPAQPAPAPQLIPIQQQNEEKTIVYVLVKKPEDAQNIVLPKIEQKPPAKPEVYFIKYNNKQDSQSVINNIVSDYNKGGVSTSYSGVGTGYSAGVKESGSSVSSGAASGVDSTSGFGSVSSGFGSTTSGFGSGSSGVGISEGSYAVSPTSSENAYGGAAIEAQNQNVGSFGSQYTSGPTVVTSSGSDSNSFSSGLESIFGTPGTIVSTSTASSEGGFDASAISTSQGVPHETYGVPKFKEY